MQLSAFDQHCEALAAIYSRVNHHLRYEKRFAAKERQEFNDALNSLCFLFRRDAAYVNSRPVAPLWHTAYRIVRLLNLTQELQDIVNNIFALKGPKYFCHKLSSKVFPALRERVQVLQMQAFCNYRLPFYARRTWDNWVETIKNNVSQVDISNLPEMERDYFQVLGEQLRCDGVAMLDQRSLMGSSPVHCLLSWTHILKLAHAKAASIFDKEKYAFLLNAMSQALCLAAKTHYTSFCLVQRKFQIDFPQKAYYEAIVSMESNQELKLPIQRMAPPEFAAQYNLDKIGQIPLKAIENEITWDMVQAISQMKKGDVRIFLLGIKVHQVIVQLTCTENGSKGQFPLFTCEVFNTGTGVYDFHLAKAEGDQKFCLPVSYLQVPGTVFNYFFCSRLIALALHETHIEKFYQHLDCSFVCHGKANKSLVYGKWYPVQKFGTCCYASLETWIMSHLDTPQIKGLQFLKALQATQKQRHLVSLLEKAPSANPNPNLILTPESKREPTPSSKPPLLRFTFNPKEKLKQSRLLLELGEEYLRTLTS